VLPAKVLGPLPFEPLSSVGTNLSEAADVPLCSLFLADRTFRSLVRHRKRKEILIM
jgi:hypothetical protein